MRAVIRITTDSILKRPATTGSPVLERQLHFDPTGRAQMERFVTKFESGSDHRLAEVDLVPSGTSKATAPATGVARGQNHERVAPTFAGHDPTSR